MSQPLREIHKLCDTNSTQHVTVRLSASGKGKEELRQASSGSVDRVASRYRFSILLGAVWILFLLFLFRFELILIRWWSGGVRVTSSHLIITPPRGFSLVVRAELKFWSDEAGGELEKFLILTKTLCSVNESFARKCGRSPRLQYMVHLSRKSFWSRLATERPHAP